MPTQAPKKPAFTNRSLVAAAHDAAMAALSFMLSVYLRLGEDQLSLALDYLEFGTLAFTVICMTVFFSMRLYRGLWRYASMRDLVTIIKAVTLSILIFAALMFLFNRLEGLPRSVLFINWMLLLFMLGGPRFAYRAMKDRTLHWQMTLEEAAKIPVLLVGANDNAERFIRDMARDIRAPYQVVGLVDNDPHQKGRSIHHVPIYGDTTIIPTIVKKLERKGTRPHKIILADEKLGGERVRELLDVADQLGLPLSRLPKASEFKTGFSETPEVQPIAVEDLLGRPQNVLDREAMRRLISGKRVLVTGAGGTIGGELTRQVASYGPASLSLLDSGEFNLYQIDREIGTSYPGLKRRAILGDVRDLRRVEEVFDAEQPELVFHAAAIKHVPLSESNVEEAVLTNVFGTRNVAEACRTFKVKAMIMISTDKAVNPTNVMGASKRLAESYCQASGADEKGEGVKFITVRFGNVLGSTGSVVPLFQEQLKNGGPLTVTHPDMTRYFMTVREAVELVLQAGVLGVAMADRQECIFVLDMGQPVKILDLALQMIRLAGLKPHEDIEIAYTGLRPGEKLFEELFYGSENAGKTSHASIFLASPRTSDLGQLRRGLEKLQAACFERDTGLTKKILKELVPEFQSAT